MADYELTRSDKSFIKGFKKFFITEQDDLSPENINEKNSAPILRKDRKKYLLKSSDDIKVQTFVIPVNEGAITAYYFSNTKISETEGLTPLIVYFHGGGWVYGNMNFYSIYIKHLAESTGSAILLFDYRLAPKYKFPVAVEDCYDAYIWAVNGAKYWKVDPDRIYVSGDGVGGNLASVISILARDRNAPMPCGQILLYPLTDCRLRTQSLSDHKMSPTLNEKMLSYYVNSYAREPKDILSPMFSPLLSQDLTRLPPALIIAGEYDPLLDDAKLYAEALRSAETEVECFVVPKGFSGYMPFEKARGRRRSEGAIWQFIQGRALKNIQLVTKKDLKTLKKKHKKTGVF